MNIDEQELLKLAAEKVAERICANPQLIHNIVLKIDHTNTIQAQRERIDRVILDAVRLASERAEKYVDGFIMSRVDCRLAALQQAADNAISKAQGALYEAARTVVHAASKDMGKTLRRAIADLLLRDDVPYLQEIFAPRVVCGCACPTKPRI